MAIRGIDVSQWQGNIDFNKVKAAGYDFVIIRAGYGRCISQKDPYFEQNYARAKAAGMGVGAYWYSYSVTAAQAKQEAEVFLETVKGKQFDYPLLYDIEDRSQSRLSNAVIGQMTDAFCGHLEKSGYYAAVYSYASFLTGKVPAEYRSKYDVWVAHYGVSKPAYSGTYGAWQYTSTARINGISGDVDCDYAYKDYPATIKGAGLNGYPKQTSPKPEVKPDTKPNTTPPAAAQKGDVNGDGKVNAADLTDLAAHIKGVKKLE